jgi:hypothetical protein
VIHLRACLILAMSALAAPRAPFAQGLPPAQHPTFSGTWAPSEPARSDQLFNVGLGSVPGEGRLILEQRVDRLTMTKEVPDEKLDPLLDINGQYYTTVVYRIVLPRGRSGGFGAAGDQRASSWQGDRLVLQDSRSSIKPFTMTFSLDGDRLKLETHVVVSQGRESNVVEWFTKVK